jgi:hypothetical protein
MNLVLSYKSHEAEHASVRVRMCLFLCVYICARECANIKYTTSILLCPLQITYACIIYIYIYIYISVAVIYISLCIHTRMKAH